MSKYDYNEGIYISQKYFINNQEYSFTYKLSYSKFSFSNLVLKMEEKGF